MQSTPSPRPTRSVFARNPINVFIAARPAPKSEIDSTRGRMYPVPQAWCSRVVHATWCPGEVTSFLSLSFCCSYFLSPGRDYRQSRYCITFEVPAAAGPRSLLYFRLDDVQNRIFLGEVPPRVECRGQCNATGSPPSAISTSRLCRNISPCLVPHRSLCVLLIRGKGRRRGTFRRAVLDMVLLMDLKRFMLDLLVLTSLKTHSRASVLDTGLKWIF